VTDVLAVNGVPEFVLVTAERSLHFHSQTIVETQGWINAISLLQAFLREQTHAAATIVTREGR
jgi:putative aminopeptidase FrvX